MTTSSGSHHRDRAVRHLEASLAARDALTDLFARGANVPRDRIAHLHDEVRLGVKLAQVQALLAIEARLTTLVPTAEDRITAGGGS